MGDPALTPLDRIVVITLFAIMLIGVGSTLGAISIPHNDFSKSPEPPSHVTPYFSRISRVDTLSGDHSQEYVISYKLQGYVIYVNVHSPTILNLYLYGPGNTTVWSRVNITTVTMSAPDVGSATPDMALGQYRVRVHNPTVQTVNYLVVIELQPIG